MPLAVHPPQVDPYVHEGFRRKHINWFDRVDPSALSPTHSHGSTTTTSSTDPSDALAAVHAVGYEPLAEQTLFQRKHFNPTHGGLARVYAPILDCLSPDPETMPGTGASPDLVASLLSAFTLASNAPAKARILLQLQRVTATPDMPGQPSVENWHRDGVNTIGIICVSRRDVEGGVSEFRAEVDNEVLSLHLAPGQLAVFEDAGVMHRVTEIACAPGAVDGARDVVLIAF